MNHYAGIDVSLEFASVCVVEGSGKIVREGKVASEPEALIAWFGSLGLSLDRIGLEAGPLSQWLYAKLKQAGFAVELLETRHVRDAFKAMPVKSDRNDARGIAQLLRLGWFRPVHCKSMEAQEVRAVLTARKLVQRKLRDVENNLRGILRGFGLKVGKTTAITFAGRIRELVVGQTSLERITDALLAVRAVLRRELSAFDRQVRSMARADIYQSTFVDVDAGGGSDRSVDLRLGDRRSGAIHIVEAGGAALWAHTEKVSVRRNRLVRPDQQNWRCLGTRSAL